MHTCLVKVVASVMGNRDSWPFREPVDPAAVPMYHQVIEEPIDLSVIKLKAEEGSYKTLREVERDFKLMVNNCETFNGPKNGYTSMVYAVWRAFRRAVIRYLDRDLEEDEQTVFLYPPKPKEQQPPTAAIEARRRKCAARHRKRMKALEVLERAAKIAVRDTQTGRSVSTALQTSVEEVPQPDTDFIIFDELSKNKISKVSGPLTGEALMKYLYNASNDSSLTAFYVDATDNLTFKSLTEWSDRIKSAGNQIILPQDAVLISPTASMSGMVSWKNMDESEERDKVRTLQVFHMNDPPSSISDKTAMTAGPPLAATPNDTAVRKNGNNRTLVIKLSRCSESGKMWRPVRFVSDTNTTNRTD